MNFKKGFTLIELLVVVAIIGILSSVVLASLNSARTTGKNAAVKANLAGARAEAEIFYENGITYEGVCATSGASTIGDSMTAAGNATDATGYAAGDTANASGTTVACHDLSGGWAAVAPLVDNTGWCVDSTGASKAVAISALDTDNDITCD